MNDIVPELLEKIQKQFQKDLKNNSKIKNILLKQKRETIDYTDSLEFAKEIGNILKDSLKENIDEELLPDGKMYYNIAQRILEPTIKNNFDIIADQCEKTQNILNKKAKIGLQSAKIDYNEEKTRSIINYISNAESYSQRENSFLSAIVTNAKSIVDDAVKNNADLHYKAGLNPKIIRTARGKTCKWCQAVAGIYDYSKVSNTGNDVFRRHANCDCSVVYDPGDKSNKVQNVWNKKIEYRPKQEEIKKRIILSKENKKISNKNIIEMRKLVGTKIGTAEISSFSEHFEERMQERGVEMKSVLDAVRKPLKIDDPKTDKQGRTSFKIVGKNATIYVNPDTGTVTTVHKTHSRVVRKLLDGKED